VRGRLRRIERQTGRSLQDPQIVSGTIHRSGGAAHAARAGPWLRL